MNPDISFNTNEITLKFLANSVYQELIGIKPDNSFADEYLFYEERLIYMFKDMLTGNYPTEQIKKIHFNYINTLIEHMKIQDRSDIIQKEYIKQVSFSKYEDSSDDKDVFDMSMNNMYLMVNNEKKEKTLDDFVLTKKIIIKEPLVSPVIKDINIKTELHKTKGVKQKNQESILK
jgi:hypothetical protein